MKYIIDNFLIYLKRKFRSFKNRKKLYSSFYEAEKQENEKTKIQIQSLLDKGLASIRERDCIETMFYLVYAGYFIGKKFDFGRQPVYGIILQQKIGLGTCTSFLTLRRYVKYYMKKQS